MRQQIRLNVTPKIFTLRLFAMFICLGILSGSSAYAVEGVTLGVTTTPPAEVGRNFNSGVAVTLSAAWASGTPPFSATFYSGTNAIGSANTLQNNVSFITSGAALGEGIKRFRVDVIDSASNPVMGSANAVETVTIDMTPPVVSVAISGGQDGTFSNNAPNNVVTVTVTSTGEPIRTPDVSVSPTGGLGGASLVADPVNPTEGNSFRYTITLTAASAGVFTVRAVGRDTTIPLATANSASGQSTFIVDTDGSQPPSISAVIPASPSKETSISLSGTAPTGTLRVIVFDGANEVGRTDVSANAWSLNLHSQAGGRRRYTARAQDNLGNTSGSSTEFIVMIDTTPPTTPVLVAPQTPTNANSITITGNTADPPGADDVRSLPVRVTLLRTNMTEVMTVAAALDGTFTFSGVPISDGDNSFFCRAEDSANGPPGNRSGLSNMVTVRKDTEGPARVTFMPPTRAIANNSYVSLRAGQVWAMIDDPNADYSMSRIEVRYNGRIIGTQVPNGSTTALVWELIAAGTLLPEDQSHDGRYDISVTPRDLLGNAGATVTSFFYFDSVPPAISSFVPAINFATPNSAAWLGLNDTAMSVTFSDAPNDNRQFFPKVGVTVVNSADASWQAGPGSGVNIATSVFTLASTIGNASGVAITASSMSLTRPAAPVVANPETDPGVVDLNMLVRSADGVNMGDVAPNRFQYNYTYKFDYIKPKVTFLRPVTNGKYMRKTIPMSGRAQDIGTDGSLRVVRVSYSTNNVSWTEANANVPNKITSWNHVLDVANWADGTYTVYVRARDQAGNYSEEANETKVTFTIKRTPPRAPVLILPLNDQVLQARGQKFRWSRVADANKYLVQIADDAAFNNVLNHQPMTGTYSALLGQITGMNGSSFSVPKDGIYHWRVASIEDCTDGYNISAFSTTRRVIVDTVKPKVLEVQPMPSTGNRITTGMVTFSIRFSENMDTTVPPTVSITSHGGQLMLIEQISFRANTWLGTTIIPRDESALYDGNAVISITGAKDLAGNEMESDATNYVVINTGPAFQTRIFSNPAHLFEIKIVTRSSEPLQAPPICSVTQSSVRVPVPMNFLKERYYAGSYRIDPELPGKAYIDLNGTDLHGMVGRGSVEFVVADIRTGMRASLTSSDGRAEVNIAPGTLAKDAAMYLISRDQLESPFAEDSPMASVIVGIRTGVSKDARSSAGLIEVMPLEELGPWGVRVKRKMLFTSELGELKTNIPLNKIHLYQFTGSRWQFCGGEIADGKIKAEIPGTGRLALLADIKPPVLVGMSPSKNQRLDDSMPLITGKFVDDGSGLDLKTARVLVDGQPLPGVTITQDGEFSVQVRTPLAKGQRQIESGISDQAGNMVVSSFLVEAPGPFTIDEFMAYPNPTRGNAVWFNYNFGQKPDSIKMRIYDSAGDRVAGFDAFSFTNLSNGRVRWDLRNDKGARVANGVYFYRLEVEKGGQKIRKRGSFAVLR